MTAAIAQALVTYYTKTEVDALIADIMALCDAVCADVQKRFGISLHPEVNFIGG